MGNINNSFSHRFTTSSSAACGRPTSTTASLTGLQHQAVQPVVGQHQQQLLSQVYNIKQCNLWSANINNSFSHRFTTSSSATCGRPTSPPASLTGLQHQAVQPVVGQHHHQLPSQRRRCPRSWPCQPG